MLFAGNKYLLLKRITVQLPCRWQEFSLCTNLNLFFLQYLPYCSVSRLECVRTPVCVKALWIFLRLHINFK